MSDTPLTAGMGALWLQIGANTEPQFLGCHSIADIKQKKGDKTLIWCKDSSGPNRFKVAGSYRGAQDPATVTVETVQHDTADFLETVGDQTVTLIILKQKMGRANLFANYDRATILRGATITQETESGVVARDPKDNTAAMQSFEFSAEDWFRILPLNAARQGTTEVNNLNCVRFLDANIGYIACKATALATANVLKTIDGGGTWAACAADPFAADEDVISLAVFPVSRTAHRVLAVRDDDVAAALKVAYSDDRGATWTTVTVGSTVGQAALGQAALFALDMHHIWLVADGGFVYFSADGGASWETQDAGVATVNDLWAVHMNNIYEGVAVGASDTILVTADGGNTWSPATATGGGDILSACYMIDSDHIWVGTQEAASNNTLYYSEDGGSTWSARSYVGSSAGKVLAVEFVDDQVGFLIHQTTAPAGTVFRTLDGGYSWEAVDTPTNAGLTSLNVMNNNRVHVCGPASGGSGFICKVNNLLGG